MLARLMGLFSRVPLPEGHTDAAPCPACLRLEQDILHLRERIRTKEHFYAAMGIALPPLRVARQAMAPLRPPGQPVGHQ
jgi:hypothetical protein